MIKYLLHLINERGISVKNRRLPLPQCCSPLHCPTPQEIHSVGNTRSISSVTIGMNTVTKNYYKNLCHQSSVLGAEQKALWCDDVLQRCRGSVHQSGVRHRTRGHACGSHNQLAAGSVRIQVLKLLTCCRCVFATSLPRPPTLPSLQRTSVGRQKKHTSTAAHSNHCKHRSWQESSGVVKRTITCSFHYWRWLFNKIPKSDIFLSSFLKMSFLHVSGIVVIILQVYK